MPKMLSSVLDIAVLEIQSESQETIMLKGPHHLVGAARAPIQHHLRLSAHFGDVHVIHSEQEMTFLLGQGSTAPHPDPIPAASFAVPFDVMGVAGEHVVCLLAVGRTLDSHERAGNG